MTVRSRAYLKDKFETGDYPSQQDFTDLFDSFHHLNEDNYPDIGITNAVFSINNASLSANDDGYYESNNIVHNLNTLAPEVVLYSPLGYELEKHNYRTLRVDTNTIKLIFTGLLEENGDYNGKIKI